MGFMQYNQQENITLIIGDITGCGMGWVGRRVII